MGCYLQPQSGMGKISRAVRKLEEGFADGDAIRNALREGRSKELQRRRWIAALCAAGVLDFAIITLYQIGLIRHLPDPPGAIFDSDKVNASSSAYAYGVPDGALGLGLYAATMALAGIGGTSRSGRHAGWDLALGAAILAGVSGAGHYLQDMIRNQKRACPYCLTGAALNVAMVPLVVPLVRDSGRQLRRQLKRRRSSSVLLGLAGVAAAGLAVMAIGARRTR